MSEIVRPANDDEAKALLGYLADKLETTPDKLDDGPFEIFAIGRRGAIMGAVMFSKYANGNIEMTCAGEVGWIDRKALRLIYAYPFQQLQCRRVTARVHAANAVMRSYCTRMGFKPEGVLREAIDGADLHLFGMLRKECKWA